MTDDEKKNAKTENEKDSKSDHEPPAGAETKGTWTGGASPIDYTATAKWLVLRKKEKPAAEIFSISYVAQSDDGGDADRPVTFVFNGGPGASSAYLHLGAVGPQRVEWPPDGSLPEMPPRLVQNESSWLAFSDLVFVDPVGTGFSRVVENEKKGDEKEKQDDATDPKEFFASMPAHERERVLGRFADLVGLPLELVVRAEAGSGSRPSPASSSATSGRLSGSTTRRSPRPIPSPIATRSQGPIRRSPA